MDWTRAIALNSAALVQIVAGLLRLLPVHGGGGSGRGAGLPQSVYREIAQTLARAESAVRRLIVIAARSLAVPALVRRPMPPGLVIVRSGPAGTGRVAFPLFDPRKDFSFDDTDGTAQDSRVGPRIRMIDDASPQAQFLALFARAEDVGAGDDANDSSASAVATLRLQRRLEATQRALAHLTREAKRMMRWRARRAAMVQPTFTSPLRPGPPPGYRKDRRDEIDRILKECHGLAFDVLQGNTS